MKKIMFNDKYGLTEAVLEGRKTMTRRIVNTPRGMTYDFCNPIAKMDNKGDVYFTVDYCDGSQRCIYPQYQIGEELAVAQRYWDLRDNDGFYEALQESDPSFPLECIKGEKGCHNKMFVRADWMPHRIIITGIELERLQDIGEKDAMREGVFKYDKPPLHHECDPFAPWPPYVKPYKHDNDNLKYRCSARYAFAYLIDKVSGRGTWNRNPWVFAYTFELIR